MTGLWPPAGGVASARAAAGAPEAAVQAAASARIAELESTVAAQQAVISTLVTAAEVRGESVTSLGTQHVVETRVARIHDAERVLRSVIESLEGALCIVGADGTVLDANRRWLRLIQPSTLPDGAGSPGPAGPAGPDGTADAGDPSARPSAGVAGAVGTDFFTWCRTAQGMAELLGRVEAIVRAVIETGCVPPDPSLPPDAVRPSAPSGQERSVKCEVGPPGERRWLVARVHAVRDHALARAVVTLTDITDGMRAQVQLRRVVEEAQRLALVAKATHSGIVITQPNGTIEWVNEAFTWRTGYALGELVGRSRPDLVHDDGPNDVESRRLASFMANIVNSRGGVGEYRLATRSGEPYWASIEVRAVVEDGHVAHLVWVEQDVTARRLAQQRLAEAMTRAERLAAALSQEKTLLAGVISAVPQLVFWKDAAGRYVGCNTAYLTFCGLAGEGELLGRDDTCLDRSDGMAEALLELEAHVIATGEPVVNRTVDLMDGAGQLRTLLLSVLPHAEGSDSARGVIGVGADITHARELERQLAQANRLESIGQLAAGIAHEINTPIQYVTGNVHFLTDIASEILTAARSITDPAHTGTHLPWSQVSKEPALATLPDIAFLSEEVPAALAACNEGLTRVAEIVRALKDYAHPGTGRVDIDVNRALESSVQVSRNEWKYVAQMHLDLAPDAGQAPCFEGELKQVILNMIVNAAQAIGEDRMRRGVPELGNITLATRRDSDHLVITIVDDGPGMDENVRRRAFDPFFTTKDVGKGTGQGLSLAHAVIVTKHRGRIDLQTSPGNGARFDLYLPLVAEPTGVDSPADAELDDRDAS